MKLSGFALVLFFFSSIVWCRVSNGQTIENTRLMGITDVTGKSTYVITYDLLASHTNIRFDVRFRFTSGGRQFFLKHVTGDAGPGIIPGSDKKAVWDYVEELIHFSGDLNIDVEARPMLEAPSAVKRTTTLTMRVTEDLVDKKMYAIKLYRKEKEIVRLNDILLIDSVFTVEVPRKTKVGNDYQLSLTDGQKVYNSNPFRVRPKVGIFWKLAPLLLVPAYFIINQNIEDNTVLPPAPDVKQP